MKNAAKKWWNYPIIIAGVALLVGIGLFFYFEMTDEDWPLQYTWFFMIFGGVAFVLIGFISQDLYRGWNRHKLNDWDNPLPDNVVNKAWLIFFPLLCSGLLSFIVGLLAYLITK